MNDVKRLVNSRGTVVIVRQLAQLVRNSSWYEAQLWYTTASQGTCGIDWARPPASRKGTHTRVAPVQEQGPTQHPTRESKSDFSCVETRFFPGSCHCAAVLQTQVPKLCTDLDISLLYILILGTYTKFARKIIS